MCLLRVIDIHSLKCRKVLFFLSLPVFSFLFYGKKSKVECTLVLISKQKLFCSTKKKKNSAKFTATVSLYIKIVM